MLYKRWKTLINFINVWRSSEPNWPTLRETKREQAFRRRSSEIVCKSPYAAGSGNSSGSEPCLPAGRDKEIRYIKKDNWIGHTMKEREVKNVIKSHIPAEKKVEDIFEIVKNQNEYK